MPLERNCVRFVDNFSGGTRGALSTERFLEVTHAALPDMHGLDGLASLARLLCLIMPCAGLAPQWCQGVGQVPRRFLSLVRLQEGYAVIFLNRKHSIQPFTKGVPSGEILECLPDVLDSSDSAASCNGFSELSDGPHDGRHMVHQAIRLAAAARQQGTLLWLPFETLFEYLAVCPSGELVQVVSGRASSQACLARRTTPAMQLANP